MTSGVEPRASAERADNHRWPGLDGLRGWAVLAVVAFHAQIADGGFLGVDVFFVLSGFLITRILVAEHGRTGTLRLSRFYARRSLRLYPALMGVVTFCVLVAVSTRRAVSDTIHDAVISLLYVTNVLGASGGLLSHTWTLALEEQFYLVWPAVLLLCLWLKRRGVRSAAWLPGLSIVVVVLLADLLTGRDGVMHTYVRAMGLPLGCALALTSTAMLHRAAKLAWPAGIALLVIMVLQPPAQLATGWPISAGALLTAPLVARVVTTDGGLFTFGTLRYLGLRSYSLYLWHVPLMSLASHQAPESIPHSLALMSGAVASMAAAEVSYRCIERPVNGWRNRRIAGARPAAGPPVSLDAPSVARSGSG
ncbi:MAG: acyltransferase [Nocardioides sp.]